MCLYVPLVPGNVKNRERERERERDERKKIVKI